MTDVIAVGERHPLAALNHQHMGLKGFVHLIHHGQRVGRSGKGAWQENDSMFQRLAAAIAHLKPECVSPGRRRRSQCDKGECYQKIGKSTRLQTDTRIVRHYRNNQIRFSIAVACGGAGSC